MNKAKIKVIGRKCFIAMKAGKIIPSSSTATKQKTLLIEGVSFGAELLKDLKAFYDRFDPDLSSVIINGMPAEPSCLDGFSVIRHEEENSPATRKSKQG